MHCCFIFYFGAVNITAETNGVKQSEVYRRVLHRKLNEMVPNYALHVRDIWDVRRRWLFESVRYPYLQQPDSSISNIIQGDDRVKYVVLLH